MKSLVLITIFIFSFISLSSQTDLDSILNSKKHNKVEYFKDTKKIQYLENCNIYGKRHGKHYSFSREGHLIGEAKFKSGKKHGKWVVYDFNGNIVALLYYNKGARVGHWKSFNESGELIAERKY